MDAVFVVVVQGRNGCSVRSSGTVQGWMQVVAHLLLVGGWVEEVLAGSRDGLVGSGKLSLVDQPRGRLNTTGVCNTHQVGRLGSCLC